MSRVFLILSLFATAVSAEAGWISVFNQDSTNFNAVQPAEKINAAGLLEYVDGVIGTGAFTHFFICPNAQVSCVDSKVFSPSWWRMTADGSERAGGQTDVCPRRDYELFTNGVDVVSVYVYGCRRKGVSPWLTFRMNDAHCPDKPEWWGHSEFWVRHPEYRRGGGYDLSHAEVRRHYLAYIEEMLGRYDVDGIECDWMRFPIVMRPGDATEIMRGVRKLADVATKRRGHRVEVSVRVSSRPEVAVSRATDAVAWAKEGLVDWVVPCNFFMSVDFELPIAEWKRLIAAVNPSVKVIPCADSGVVTKDAKTGKNNGRRLLTLAEYREWACRMQQQGAEGIYLFNLFTFLEAAYHASSLEPWNVIRREGLSPEAIRGKPRSFPSGWMYEK